MDGNEMNLYTGNLTDDMADEVSEQVDEAVEAESVEVTENSEYESSPGQNGDDTEEENAEQNEAHSYETLPDTAENPENPEKKTKKNKGAVVVLVLLIAVLVAATGFMIYSIIGSKSSPKIDLEKTVVTVAGVESNAAEYMQIYSYYSAYYGMYGYQADEEELKELVLREFIYMNTFYAKAVEEGYTLDDDELAAIEENIALIKEDAESTSVTLDEYLAEAVCSGYTLDMYRESMERQYLVQKYINDNLEKIEAEFSGDDIAKKVEAEYSANADKYDLCDAARWMVDVSDENADKYIEKIISEVNSGKTLKDAVVSVTGDSDAIVNNMQGYTYEEISSNFSEETADWLFERGIDGKYVNGKGSVTTAEVSGMTFIIYVNDVPSRDETLPATAYYIQVAVGTDTTISTETELKAAAKVSATKIFDEFGKGNKSSNAFTELMKKYDGSDSMVVADMFSNVTGDGTNDPAAETWIMDPARKAGDCEVVEGDDCYYVLFFTEKAENPVWYQTILASLLSDAQTKWEDSIVDMDDLEQAVTDDDAIAEIIAYVNEKSAGSGSYVNKY